MKRKLLNSATLLLLSGGLFAQTVITSANQVPSQGDSISYSLIDVCENTAYRFSYEIDGKGPASSKIWDFRRLNNYGSQAIVYDTAGGTVLNDSFPTSTHLLHFSGKGFMGKTTTQQTCAIGSVPAGFEVWEFTGNGGNDTVWRNAFAKSATVIEQWFDNKGVPRLIFPFKVGDSWGGNYTGKSRDSFSGDSALIEESSYNATVVAEGKLVLPPLPTNTDTSVNAGEEFDNIVCIKVKEVFKINIYTTTQQGVAVLPGLLIDEDYYAWFKEGVQEPIMVYYVTASDLSGIGGKKDTTNVFKYQAIDGSDPTFLAVEEELNSKFEVYPNPSNGIFNVNLNKATDATVSVFDVLGCEILTKNLRGSQTQIDLSNQTKGMYFIKVNVGNQISTEKIILK